MKLLTIFFLLVVNTSLFGYRFSDELPQNTIFYLSIEDFNTFSNNLKKISKNNIYETKEFKFIEKEIIKILSIDIYNEDTNMDKMNLLYKDFKKLLFNSFSFSIGLNKFLKPEYSLIIKGKDLDKVFKNIYTEIIKNKYKGNIVNFKKEIYRGIKIDIIDIRIKQKIKKYDRKPIFNTKKAMNTERTIKIVYAMINKELIITGSVDYIKLLISNIKNKNIPKLSNNLIFKKDRVMHLKSNFYMFLNLKTIIKLLSIEPKVKQTIKNYSLNKLTSIISYINFSNNNYSTFVKLTSSNGLPDIIKSSLTLNNQIKIPQFIPSSCYSFNAFNINFSNLFIMLNKFNDKRDTKKIRNIEDGLGIKFKLLFDNFGKELYVLKFFKDEKTSTIILFSFNKSNFLLKLIEGLGGNPMFGVAEKDYLEGKLFTISSNSTLLGYALGYKNNQFIIGDIGIVKEFMQNMGGNSGSFYNTPFYKKIITEISKKQNFVSFSNNAIYFYGVMQSLKQDMKRNKLYIATNKKEMKVLKSLKHIISKLSDIKLDKLKKFMNYSLMEFYIDKYDLVLEFKQIK